MGKKSDPPKAPDPTEVAGAQTGTNVATAVANTAMGQVNQVTPDGSLTYDQTGTFQFRDPSTGQVYTMPRYTATTTLSPEAQAIRDANNRADLSLSTLAADQAGRAGGLLSRPLDLATLPDSPDWAGMARPEYAAGVTAPDLRTGYQSDFGAQRQEIVDALMGQINEQRDRDLEKMNSDMVARGINLGTEQYSRGVDDLQRSTDNARVQALLAAGQEESRLVGMARDEAAFGNDAALADFNNRLTVQGRDDAIKDANWSRDMDVNTALERERGTKLSELLALRNQPINEITALLSGSQVQTPNFAIATPSSMPTTDVAGITQQGYANKLQSWQIQQQQQAALTNGLFSLGSSYLLGR